MHSNLLHRHCQRQSTGRSAFTLIELLIVVAVLLTLATLTLAIFNSTSESDRIRSSARQLQSALLGARDRAIHAKAPRGLRFIIQDRSDLAAPAAHLINSMVYIGSEEDWSNGSIRLDSPDFSIPSIGHVDSAPGDNTKELDELIVVRGVGTDWKLLLDQQLIEAGSRIEIPAKSNRWYTIADVSFLNSPPPGVGTDEVLILARNGVAKDVQANTPYRLELKPTILPGQEPLRLSSGIVIDLSRSEVPSNWSPATGSLDIIFSPRGWAQDSAQTPISPSGLVHFYLCTQEDADLGRGPTSQGSGEKLILSFVPRTGNVATYPVDVSTSDPFSFAKRGGTAAR